MERIFNILILSIIWHQSNAFVPPTRLLVTPLTTTSIQHPLSNIELSAKRRRRKNAPQPTAEDELPDFDMNEDDDDTPLPMQPTPQRKPTPKTVPQTKTEIKRGTGLSSQLAEDLGGNVDGLDEDLIVSAMRGQGEAWAPPTSIEETLRDRSLEKFMNFDAQIQRDGSAGDTVELPTMEEVINRRKREAMQEGRVEEAAMLIDTEGMGKKAAKRAERKAAAMKREEEEKAKEGGFDLEGLNVLKLLENGAWVGIGMLVLWEIYINSPFFERAAPLIPAVFD